MPRTKIYINSHTQSVLTIIKDTLRFRSYDETVRYLSSLYKPPTEPVWLDRGAFLTPIQPGTPTHINQHLPLSVEAIQEVMRPSMKGQPLQVANIVRVELPDDGVGKARIKYINKGTPKPKPIPIVKEVFYSNDDDGATDEAYPLTDEEVIATFNREKELKNRFSLREDK